ncbi:MAG: M64 family metallopeptidase [Myxococcota bacterium]|jgi:hypothetical protein|nr:M64 family metallopeptidase [Myxococcota bacterium]
MKGVIGFPLCAVGLLAAFQARAQEYAVETIATTGDPINRVDIVILGDGYTISQQDKLTRDVNDFLAVFWAASPYGNYRSFFNIKLVHVVSNQDGADHGSYGAQRDTALGAFFNCMAIDRLLCVNDGAVYSVQGQYAPEADYIFIIVNDPKYGGAGGPYSTFSVNEYAGEIAMHEFGHSLGGLADEYDDPYPGYGSCSGDCPEWNATTVTDRESLKWNVWVDLLTPIPTPETNPYRHVVGVFEGARYQSVGVYRPKFDCGMRSLGAGFCEVCRERLVLSIYNRVTPLDDKLPGDDEVPVLGGRSVQLAVQRPTPVPDTMSFAWTVNGSPVSGSASARVFTALGLGEGTHAVRVDIADQTTLTRRDPYSTMHAFAAWTLNVEATTDTTNADTDTNPVDTDTTDTAVDTGTGTSDTGTETKDTDTGTIDADTEEPALCTPGSKECTGLYEWAVCSNDGSRWIPWDNCTVGEICDAGECVNPNADSDNDDDGSSSGNSDACGCTTVGARPLMKLLEIVLALASSGWE